MKTATGLDELVANFNREIMKIKGLSEVGLIKMAITIERSWNYDAPVIPVDTNNLRQSWFAITHVKSHSAAHNFKGKNGPHISHVSRRGSRGHYMLSWIAGSLELVGLWKVGNKSKLGFVFNGLCCILWVAHVLSTWEAPGLVPGECSIQ